MGNKAATGPFQLEQAIEVPGFHTGAMSANDARDEACASVVVPQSGDAEGSGDERAYVSREEGSGEDADASVDVAPTEGGVDGIVNFTRNNSQSSMSNNRPTPAAAVTAVIVGEPVLEGTAVAGERRPAEPVPPPPRVGLPGSVSATGSASPPRVPGGSNLQLPPLQDLPLQGSEEARLSARGSPSSADGRDQKGAQ